MKHTTVATILGFVAMLSGRWVAAMFCFIIAIGYGWFMENQRQHQELLAAIVPIPPSLPPNVYENPLDRIARQTLINGSYGEAMTKAKEVSIENHDSWYVIKDTEGFSAVPVPLYEWGGHQLIAVFDNGWQLPDK